MLVAEVIQGTRRIRSWGLAPPVTRSAADSDPVQPRVKPSWHPKTLGRYLGRYLAQCLQLSWSGNEVVCFVDIVLAVQTGKREDVSLEHTWSNPGPTIVDHDIRP
jgi:hypothetical protein